MEKITSPEVVQLKVSLREADTDDQKFLFKVVHTSMQPVYEASGDVIKDEETAFREFQKKYTLKDLKVIQYEGKDVGRLRLETTDDGFIYVNGIHILPEYQNLGIGTSILSDLVTESKRSGIPMRLEVRDVNTRAKTLYKRMGFIEKWTTTRGGHSYFLMEFIPN